MPFKSQEHFMREYLAKPEMAAAYLKACIEDGNPWLIADAFRTVEAIHGQAEISIHLKPVHRRSPRPKSIPSRVTAKRTRRVAS
jgi:hypothetical protein